MSRSKTCANEHKGVRAHAYAYTCVCNKCAKKKNYAPPGVRNKCAIKKNYAPAAWLNYRAMISRVEIVCGRGATEISHAASRVANLADPSSPPPVASAV